jgi:hypothetical protein
MGVVALIGHLPGSSKSRWIPLETAEGKARILASHPDGVRQRYADRGASCDVRHVVEVALRVRILEINGRVQNLVANREHGGHRLERAGRAHHVTNHRL